MLEMSKETSLRGLGRCAKLELSQFVWITGLQADTIFFIRQGGCPTPSPMNQYSSANLLSCSIPSLVTTLDNFTTLCRRGTHSSDKELHRQDIRCDELIPKRIVHQVCCSEAERKEKGYRSKSDRWPRHVTPSEEKAIF